MDANFKTLEPCSTVTLPMDLILSRILPKLPAKSLFRFKCVSNCFLTEISSPKFNALFAEANHRLLILPGDYGSFSIYELDSLHSPPTLCPYPIPSQWCAPRMSMVASCESYLLIACGYTDLEGLILLNPTTRIYRVLPKVYVPTWHDSLHYGMCHCLDDELNGDFKIVRIVKCNGLRKVIVYSLRTNSWKSIESKKPTTESTGNPVLVQNNLLVMICYSISTDCMTRIGCFDMKAERWSNDVLLSDILLGEIGSTITRYDDHYDHLGVLEGQLLFSCYEVKKSSYSVWVMEEYGVKESWFKLMSLPGQGVEGVYRPITYRKGSSHELLCLPNSNGRHFWYNLHDKKITKTGIDGDGLNTSHFAFAYICKQSLFNFPGGLLIHSSSKLREVDDDNGNDDDWNDYHDGYVYSYGEWL